LKDHITGQHIRGAFKQGCDIISISYVWIFDLARWVSVNRQHVSDTRKSTLL